MQALSEQLAALQADYDNMAAENKKYRQMVINQATEISQLSTQNREVKAQRDEANNNIRVLKVQLDESNESLSKVRKELANSASRIKALEDEMANLIKELADMTKMFEIKEVEHKNLTEELRRLIEQLKLKLTTSEATNLSLREKIEEYLAEIERLKRKLANDRRFKHFVAIKREVNELRDQKDELLIKVTAHERETPLPVMKATGKVTTEGSRVRSAGSVTPSNDRSEVKLSRPKSAKTLRPLTKEDFT